MNPTDAKALFGAIGYQFHPASICTAASTRCPAPGRSGSHPFWLGHDRMMADRLYRPYFTHGVWAKGALFQALLFTRP